MKGLFTKDLMILYNQRKTLAMVLFLGIVIAISHEPGSVIAYLSIISGMLALGTLSYDEMDHGYGYLLTLPTSRKTYVREKYLFSFLIVILSMAIGVISCIVLMMLSSEPPVIHWNEIWVTTGVIFIFVMLLLAVEIPLRLKFGIEKGRIVLYVMFGMLAIGAVALSRYFPEEEFSKVGTLLTSKIFLILGSAALGSLLLLYLSFVLSTKIFIKKEF